MTIKSITPIALDLPFEVGGPKSQFAGRPRQMAMLLVRVETGDGIVGWGEAFYAQPSVTKIGGISEMMRIAKLAAEHGVKLVPHSPYFGPGLLASMHMAAAFAHETMIEYSFVELGASPLGDAIALRDGFVSVPQGPGLGRDPDADVIARYRVD